MTTTENNQIGSHSLLCPIDDLAGLPLYESMASPEETQAKLEWMAKQLSLIHDQEKIGTPIRHIKIRCGCNKLVGWMYMYRCLYCGIWFCKDCAQLHFGKRVAEPFAGVLR